MAYLDDNPPVRSQFRCPRRERPSGVVVVHTAESTPDFVATDGGAEAVAKFIRGRSDPGSYHDIADSDSCINLVSYGCEAFHDGTGSNPHSYGVSAATRAAVWPLAPPAWRDGCVYQMAAAAARYATWLRSTSGVVIPARRITRTESEARMPGFISHAERDPARRTDPGAQFPWAQFLATFDRLTAKDGGTAPKPPDSVEDPEMPYLVKTAEQPETYLVIGNERLWINTSQAMTDVKAKYGPDLRTGTGGVPLVWPTWMVQTLRPRRPADNRYPEYA